MLKSVAAAVLVIVPTTALADPGAKIAAEAKRCWNVPADVQLDDFSVRVSARVRDGGYADFRLSDEAPQSGMAGAAARSALRALQACAPYDVPPGRYQFDMIYEDPFED